MEVGDRVNWCHRPRGGYGHTISVAAVITKIGASRIQIRIAQKISRTWETSTKWVSPTSLILRSIWVPAVDDHSALSLTNGCLMENGRPLLVEFPNMEWIFDIIPPSVDHPEGAIVYVDEGKRQQCPLSAIVTSLA